jgi:RHS repeat-associated protein
MTQSLQSGHPLNPRFRARLARGCAGALLGLLLSPHVGAQAVGNAFDQTRTVAFEYHPNGMLKAEVVEPGLPQQCVRTEHSYDDYGNKSGAVVSNCAGATGLAKVLTRTSSSTYGSQGPVSGIPGQVALPAAPLGTFATNSSVVVGPGNTHNEQRLHDVRFGGVLRLIGPNGPALATTWAYDDFGRKVRENRADGTYTVIRHCILASSTLDTSSNSSGCMATPPGGEPPPPAVRYESTESYDAAGNSVAGFLRTYFDRAGQVVRVVTEGFDGTAIAQDTHYTAHGAVRLKTAPYFRTTGRSTVAGSGNLHGLTLTEYDALGRATAVYTSQPPASNGFGGTTEAGSVEVDFGATYNTTPYGLRRASRVATAYNGLQSTTTDDDGRTRLEERNPDGKVVRTTDALGAQISHLHDALGQLIQTLDALGNRIVVRYDQRGRKVRLEDPDAGNTSYCYDALGQLKAQQTSNQRAGHGTEGCPTFDGDSTTTGTAAENTAAAKWTTLAYDALGRLTSRTSRTAAAVEYTTTWHFDTTGVGATTTCGASIGKACRAQTTHGVTRLFSYDNLGRPIGTRLDVSSGPSMAQRLTYDTAGRVATQTYPTGVRVRYEYTARGHLSRVATDTELTGLAGLPSNRMGANSTLWQADTVNAWGKAEQATYGNGVVNRAEFEAQTGRTLRLSAEKGAEKALDQRLAWDNVGQLNTRIDAIGAGGGIQISDSYQYDELGRLKQYTVAGSGTPSSRTVHLQYNAAGMLLFKSDVGIYTYGAQGVTNGRPHAVQRVEGAHNSSYTYDWNGNITGATGGKYRSVAYTSFNLPDGSNGVQGPAGSPRFTWQYDDAQARIRETRVNAQGTRTTWYLHPDNAGGLGFEREVSPSGAAQNRHYVSAGGVAIGVIVTTGALPTLATGQTVVPELHGNTIAVARVEYWHKDHLGSLVASTNHLGVVTARYSYEPFGKRRNVSGTYDAFGTVVVDFSADPVVAGTDRGYTGHEHLDDVGLIHMNGRVFDPVIARFMQPDPFVQEPGNLQNYDRYAYCFNSPASCTDPTGLIFKRLGKKLSKIWREEIWRSSAGRTILSFGIGLAAASIAGPYAAQWLAGTTHAATAGFSAAAINATVLAAEAFAFAGASSLVATGGDLKLAAKAASYSALTAGAGSLFGSSAAFKFSLGAARGWTETKSEKGALRWGLAALIPRDLGLSAAYQTDAAAHVAIQLSADAIRGAARSGRVSGWRAGVRDGQFTNVLGHIVGFATAEYKGFERGAFVYRDGLWQTNQWSAVSLGNVVVGSSYTLTSLKGYIWEHELAHQEQSDWLGSRYIPVHLMSMGFSMLLSGSTHSSSNLLECKKPWISKPEPSC